MGETQTGKSSLINTMYGQSVCQVGDGGLESTTDESQLQDAIMVDQVGLALKDSIGINDTRGKYSNDHILKNTAAQMIKADSDQCKFILTHNLNYSPNIKANVALLQSIYGPEVTESMVGVLTMHNLVPQCDKKIRLEKALQICREIGITCIEAKTNWTDSTLTQSESFSQNWDIKWAIDSVKPYSSLSLQGHQQMLEQDAIKLLQSGPKREVNCRKQMGRVRKDKTDAVRWSGILVHQQQDQLFQFFALLQQLLVQGLLVEWLPHSLLKQLLMTTKMGWSKCAIMSRCALQKIAGKRLQITIQRIAVLEYLRTVPE
ncbi:hypothetical protein FGO68_gene10359 [Halteria grandinella]|uniref:Uncharacterized protein n=1 Tax=Halteria grandinella TaxID=5974 RepID=A0A8J8SVN8_HALGN|nr:hypothetical protein FGO68_gene10359 [Halteria grandinella]